jgi:hypothetical protein
MKILITALLAFGGSVGSVMATTHVDINPVLQYDENYEIDEKSESNHQYLVVVPEEMSFPNSKQKARFERAQSILETVMNSEEFKYRVLAYIRSSDGQRLYQKNYLWNDSETRFTNEDVYDLVMGGNEFMVPDTLGEMNLNAYVKQCNWFMNKVSIWCRAVIGSTNPGSSKWIKLNWKFYKRYKTSEMVSNMVHEWLHLLGFLHGKENMREEVPYVVGSIAGQVAKEYLAQEGLEN